MFTIITFKKDLLKSEKSVLSSNRGIIYSVYPLFELFSLYLLSYIANAFNGFEQNLRGYYGEGIIICR